MTTQAHTPAQTLERYYLIARHYRDETRADLKRTQAATDSLIREVDAASATHCAMLTGAYRNAADRLSLPPETDGPAYVKACAQLADVRMYAEEAGKLAGLALETAAQVQA